MFHVFGLFLPAASTANGPVQSTIEAAATANTFLVFWLTRCLVFWNRCTIRRRRRPRLGWSGIILFVVVDDDVVVAAVWLMEPYPSIVSFILDYKLSDPFRFPWKGFGEGFACCEQQKIL